MKMRWIVLGYACLSLLSIAFSVQAQDLGPGFTKIKDGIYVFAPDDWHDQNRLEVNIDVAYKLVKE